MSPKTIYNRPSPRLRVSIGEGVPCLILRKKYVPQEGRKPFRLLLKVHTSNGLTGWMDP